MKGEDLREGLTCVVSVKLSNPQFEGQTKGKLGNSDILGIVEGSVVDMLGTYLEENPSIARKIVDKCINSAIAREAARKAANLHDVKLSWMVVVFLENLLTAAKKMLLSAKFFLSRVIAQVVALKWDGIEPFRLFLPLKGKILNVEKARLDKIISHEEIQVMVQAFGTGFGRSDGRRWI